MERKPMPAAPTITINIGSGMELTIAKEPPNHNKDVYSVIVQKTCSPSEMAEFAGLKNVTQVGMYTNIVNGYVEDWHGFIEWKPNGAKEGNLSRLWVGEGFSPFAEHSPYNDRIKQSLLMTLDEILEDTLTAELGNALSGKARAAFKEWVKSEIDYLNNLLEEDDAEYHESKKESVDPSLMVSSIKGEEEQESLLDLALDETPITTPHPAVPSPEGLPAPTSQSLPAPKNYLRAS